MITEVATWWRDGGVWMYAVLLAALVDVVAIAFGIGMSIAARFFPPLVWPARIVSVLVLMASALPLFLGVIGWRMAIRNVYAAVSVIDPSQKDTLIAYGLAEARTPLELGGGVSCVMFAGAMLPLLLTLGAGRSPDDDVR